MKLLLVDDDNIICKIVTNILSQLGVEAMAIQNPIEAAFACNKFHPDVILLDIEMPALTGEELLNSFIKFEIFPTSKIYLFTAHADRDYIQNLAKELELGGVVAKSGGPENLLQELQRVTEKHDV